MTYKTVFVSSSPVYRRRPILIGTADEVAAIDPHELTSNIEAACNRLADEGFEVVWITPHVSGDFMKVFEGGAGWSYTTGVVITAKKLS